MRAVFPYISACVVPACSTFPGLRTLCTLGLDLVLHSFTLGSEIGEIMTSPSSMYALVIGINTYAQEEPARRLSSIRGDAFTISRFLWEYLGVDKDNIKLLVDAKATRADIISAFHDHLIDNMDIKEGDPILIYFAGDGSRYKHKDAIIEAICPYDRGSEASKGGSITVDIADRTLAKLFSKLSEKKGNNVTVVMDCCYSASEQTDVEGTNGQLLRARYLPPIPGDNAVAEMLTGLSGSSLPEPGPYTATDDNIDSSGAKRLLRQEYKTHVLLTACNQDECAYEDILTKSGLFTSALVAELFNVMSQPHLSLRTPQMLVKAICTSKSLRRDPELESTVFQPQCYGHKSHSVLFDGKVSRNKRNRYQLRRSQSRHEDSATMWVAQGAMHGISQGTEFAVWPSAFDRPGSDKPLTIVVVKQAHPTWSTITRIAACRGMPLPEGSLFVEVIWWANMAVPINVQFSGLGLESSNLVQQQLQRLRAGERTAGIEVAVKHAEDATLLISMQNGMVSVHRKENQDINRAMTWKYPSNCNPLAMVNRALLSEMHLNRTNKVHLWHNSVEVDFLKMEPSKVTSATKILQEEGRKDNVGLYKIQIDEEEDTNRPQFCVSIRPRNNEYLKLAVYWFNPATCIVSELEHTMPLDKCDDSSNSLGFVVPETVQKGTYFAKIFLSKQEEEDFSQTLSDSCWDTLTMTIEVSGVS